MRIDVQLHGELRRALATRWMELNLRDGATVAEAIASLGLRSGQVWLAMLDGRLVEMDRPLRPGDNLSLVPPVGGGH
jgi:molybdopterin converting factor small subunit